MTSVRDIIIVVAILFAIGITVILAADIGHRVNSNLLTIPVMNNSAEAVSVIEHADAAIDMSDYTYLALFIGFFFSIIIFGWFVGGTPIVAPIYFFIVIFFVFAAVILQLVWLDMSANVELMSASVRLPITNYILSHLGYFTAVFGLAGILAMFAKPSNGGTY